MELDQILEWQCPVCKKYKSKRKDLGCEIANAIKKNKAILIKNINLIIKDDCSCKYFEGAK